MENIIKLIIVLSIFSFGCNKNNEIDNASIDDTLNLEFEIQEIIIPEEYKCSSKRGAISIDDENNIWLVCSDFCITKYQPQINEWVKDEIEINFGPPSRGITSVAPDNEGGIWLGTMFRGLMRVKNGEIIENYMTSNSQIKANTIVGVKQDESGNLWMSLREFKYDTITYDPFYEYSGLVKFDGELFTYIDTSNSAIPSNTVNDIEIKGEKVYVATSPLKQIYPMPPDPEWKGGIGVYDGTNWEVFDMGNTTGLITNFTSGLNIDENENIWFNNFREPSGASYDYGYRIICKIDENGGRSLTDREEFPAFGGTILSEHGNENVWVVGYPNMNGRDFKEGGGLYLIESGEVKDLSIFLEVINLEIPSIGIDGNNDLWLGNCHKLFKISRI